MRSTLTTASSRPTVLALRALGLGDLLTSVPALRGLRRAFPHHRVVLATRPALEPLVREMPFVDSMIEAAPLQPLWVQMDSDDIAVNLHGRGPESTDRLLETSPRRLIAFSHPDIPATYGSPRWRRHEHETARWCRLLGGHGIEASPEELRLDPPARKARAATTIVHPGAGAPARHWPPDRWAIVARELARAGEDVVVTGSKDEEPLAREIAREAGLADDSVMAGRTDVAELAATVASARRLLSCDTGPAHLATAYGTPSVVLFGPVPPSEWGPPPGGNHHAIWKGRTGDPNATACHLGLLEITVDEVLERVEAMP